MPGSEICVSNAPWDSGLGSDIFLEWESVPNASNYIVQWCKNGSFRGPTLRAVDVTTTSYELKLSDDIRHGDEIHWRVMAYNNFGGLSSKSEPRSFKYQCPKPQSGKKGGSGNSDNSDLCDEFNVGIEIKGVDIMRCCETKLFVVHFSYDCKDEDGNQIVSLTNIAWSLVVPQAEVGNVTIPGAVNGRTVGVKSNCIDDVIFDVKVCLTFTHAHTGATFICCKSKEVVVDCSTDSKDDLGMTTLNIPYTYTESLADAWDDTGNRLGSDSVTVTSEALTGPVFIVESTTTDVSQNGHTPECNNSASLGTTLGEKVGEVNTSEKKVALEARINPDKDEITAVTVWSTDPNSFSIEMDRNTGLAKWSITGEQMQIWENNSGMLHNPSVIRTVTNFGYLIASDFCYACTHDIYVAPGPGFSDTFYDDDDVDLADHIPDIGGHWEAGAAAASDWEINSNTIANSVADPDNDSYQAVVPSSVSAPNKITADLTIGTHTTTGVFVGLIVRYLDENNYFVGGIYNDGSTSGARIYERVGGGFTLRASSAFTIAESTASHSVFVRNEATQIVCDMNGFVATYSTTLNATERNCGILGHTFVGTGVGANDLTVDNLIIEGIPE